MKKMKLIRIAWLAILNGIILFKIYKFGEVDWLLCTVMMCGLLVLQLIETFAEN